jgi:CO dehydrogenase maturation factor
VAWRPPAGAFSPHGERVTRQELTPVYIFTIIFVNSFTENPQEEGMSFLIAMAGKGGTGKTTVSALLLRYLVEHGKTPVLAVDADANSNFNEVLGLPVEHTVGEAREEMKKGAGLVDITKDQLIEMRINQCLVEADGFDLMAMGQPEGPGCYCAANNLVAHFMEVLAKNYPYILMDNEAGMEHMSRLTTNRVDLLILVSDPSWRGIQAARRLKDLAQRLKIVVGRPVLIVNRVTNGLSDRSRAEIETQGLELAGLIPEDPEIAEFDRQGLPTFTLPADSLALQAAYKIFNQFLS